MKTLKLFILSLAVCAMFIPNKTISKDYSLVDDIGHAIKVLNDREDPRLAKIIYQHSRKYKQNPWLMLALIKVESNFNQAAVSRTGDISMVQINVKVWEKEFNRLGLNFDKQRLKTDREYAIGQMAKILRILKDRHATDPLWYGRYHSGTKKYKLIYTDKVRKELKKVANSAAFYQSL